MLIFEYGHMGWGQVGGPLTYSAAGLRENHPKEQRQ